jgi:cation diffusion facilitator family transporter
VWKSRIAAVIDQDIPLALITEPEPLKDDRMTAPETLPANQISTTAGISIVVALAVMALKYLAYHKTGSAALYSDALESIVNVVAAIAALLAVRISALPPDHNHPFGHHKAEFFSAVLEGTLIIIAALLIFEEAYRAWLAPRALDQPAAGLAINGLATAINAVWGWYLIRRGRSLRSPALSAGGWHVLADVITSLGVLAGLGLSIATGWAVLDPVLAVLVGFNILWAGYSITTRSINSLMDVSAGPEVENEIRATIQAAGFGALQAHDVRTRHAGRVTFIEFHLVVPGEMTVQASHDICDRLEDALQARIAGAEVVIHVEPGDKAKDTDAVPL